MIDNWVIHKLGDRLIYVVNGIKTAKYCNEINKDILLKFHNQLFAEGLSIPRVVKYLTLLCQIDKKINKDFTKVDKQDIVDYLTWLETSHYSEYTKKDFKVTLKKFYKWQNNGTLPSHISWISCRLSDRKKMMPQELLTQDDIIKLIQHAGNDRNKAFISTLYESGCRIGELMTLKLKQVSFDNYGAILMVHGKTGSRRIRIISSSNLIGKWLNNHPDSTNKDNYLWSNLRKNELISYDYIRHLLKVISKKSKIGKKVNPHSFRHARATHLANKLTEAQMKEYFGWTQGSNMASVYVHLSGRDVDSAILSLHGLKMEKTEEDMMRSIGCSCGELNNPANNYCNKCGKPLRTETAVQLDDKKKEISNIINLLIKDPETFEKLKLVVQTK
jgi:site-specific recombinase XerD